MGKLSALAKRAKALESLYDETNRYIDFAVAFREVDRINGDVTATGRYSKVYGWRYDRQRINVNGTVGGYIDGDELDDLRVHVLDCNPSQFSVLVDDVSKHIIVYGSRRSSKTMLGIRWDAKMVAKWPGKSHSVVKEKRKKGRKLVELGILPNVPAHWIDDPRNDLRKSQDELYIRWANGHQTDFLSANVPDDARGDGVVGAFIDESQLAGTEARSNLILSLSDAGSDFQTLETATLLSGDFEDYLDAAKQNDLYRVEELSVTDNIHLETVWDDVCQAEIPAFVISARSIMPKDLFEQEVGKWDDNAKRFRPTPMSISESVYWAFKRSHVVDVGLRPDKVIRRLFASAHKGVGNDITSRVTQARTRSTYSLIVATDSEKSPYAAVVARVFETPPGVPDLLWVVDELTVTETDGIRLADAIKSAGYGSGVVIADAAGKNSHGGKSTNGQMRLAGLDVRGSARNPADKDRISAVLAKLLNGNNEVTLLVDSKCVKTIDGLRNHKKTPRGKEEEMEDGRHHHARALGHLCHFFWSPLREEAKVA